MLLVDGGQRSPPSSLTRPKKGGSGSLSKLASRSQYCTSGRTKIPPPPPPGGITFGTKPRHRKRRHSSGWLSIRQWQLMSGEIKSRWKSTKVAPIVAPSQWNQWSTCSTVVPLLNMSVEIRCQHHLATLCQKRNLGPHKSFSMLLCLFYQPLCKTLKRFSRTSFFLRSGLPWIIWRK